ncbi:unnamed protein product [Closterium sp. Naga37s-1]|nr:unnamed protein product [Closterium sp. Naga37s-1]
MLVGWGGNNGSTLTAGVIANREGISWLTKDGIQVANYFGSVTQASTCRVGSYKGEEIYVPFKSLLPMVDPNEVVFGGWDISSMNLADAMARAKVLDIDLQKQLYSHMKDMSPLPGIYDPDFIASNQEARANNVIKGSKKEQMLQIIQDIRKFKETSGVDSVVVLWTANTERYSDVLTGLNDTKENLFNAIDRNESEISPSTLYAAACIHEKVPFINGSPQNTFVPGLIEYALENNSLIGGDDFKSGQTKMKSVLVDFLVSAGIKPMSIVSYNHLGNNDGMNLSAPQTFRSKEISKSNVVDDMVASNSIIYDKGQHPDHVVVIKYVPYVGDSKRAMDEYTSEIFMGGKNTIVMHNTCEDSLLAAPLILDLVLLAELFTRIQLRREEEEFHSFHPVASLLSYLSKAPLVPFGTPVVNALAKQRGMLENVLRAGEGGGEEEGQGLWHVVRACGVESAEGLSGVVDKWGWTAMHVAARNGDSPVVSLTCLPPAPMQHSHAPALTHAAQPCTSSHPCSTAMHQLSPMQHSHAPALTHAAQPCTSSHPCSTAMHQLSPMQHSHAPALTHAAQPCTSSHPCSTAMHQLSPMQHSHAPALTHAAQPCTSSHPCSTAMHQLSPMQHSHAPALTHAAQPCTSSHPCSTAMHQLSPMQHSHAPALTHAAQPCTSSHPCSTAMHQLSPMQHSHAPALTHAAQPCTSSHPCSTAMHQLSPMQHSHAPALTHAAQPCTSSHPCSTAMHQLSPMQHSHAARSTLSEPTVHHAHGPHSPCCPLLSLPAVLPCMCLQLQALLRMGMPAGVCSTRNATTPLHVAAYGGHVDCMCLLAAVRAWRLAHLVSPFPSHLHSTPSLFLPSCPHPSPSGEPYTNCTALNPFVQWNLQPLLPATPPSFTLTSPPPPAFTPPYALSSICLWTSLSAIAPGRTQATALLPLPPHTKPADADAGSGGEKAVGGAVGSSQGVQGEWAVAGYEAMRVVQVGGGWRQGSYGLPSSLAASAAPAVSGRQGDLSGNLCCTSL